MTDDRWPLDASSAARIADVTAEALLGNVLDTMPTGLFTVDKRGRITSWNRAMEQMTGFAAAEALGRDCSILQGDKCSGTACGDAETRGCPLFQERTDVERRCSIRRRDGETLPVLKKMRIMRGERGKIVGGVECLTDLSQMLSLEAELTNVRREATGHARFGLIGHHPSMQRLGELVELAGRSNASVLIQGETGTGKEIVARAIFEASARSDKPFIRVSCAALTETLLESELFGHVRGAFTGAIASRMGRFEAADGGTVFLDEIGDISPAVQTKLLRVLQEREFERVGDNRPIKVDVRFIAATNCSLSDACEHGRFRRDLYYRLAVIPIQLPALRKRREDVPLLVDYFLDRLNRTSGRSILSVSPEAMQLLSAYEWPGNVRELENAIEYAFAVTAGDTILTEGLPPSLLAASIAPRPGPRTSRRSPATTPSVARVAAVLERHAGNRSSAARELGVSRVTLWKWLKRADAEKMNGPP